jgi:hypothetical protein
MKKLKIVKNSLTQSINFKDLEQINLLNIYPNTNPNIQSKPNTNPTTTSLQRSGDNYFYNINKFVTPSSKLKQNMISPGPTQQAKGKLTFDNVFNNNSNTTKSNNNVFSFPQGNNANIPTIPPIIIGNMQNQPQISININNFNINNYSSSTNNKSAKFNNDLISSPMKKEPIRIFNNNNLVKSSDKQLINSKYINVNTNSNLHSIDNNTNNLNNMGTNKQQQQLSTSKIKLVKKDMKVSDDESFSILPHSNSNILRKSKKVND